jgi:hypothetical protein
MMPDMNDEKARLIEDNIGMRKMTANVLETMVEILTVLKTGKPYARKDYDPTADRQRWEKMDYRMVKAENIVLAENMIADDHALKLFMKAIVMSRIMSGEIKEDAQTKEQP